ncbi:hypothetical protein BD410DRAFT_846209 [Rickenella mellea]|uniref:Uncharacterized protein n=1 Tax=Rickenella mellea TaxID=50990 RepID=A0A4Y7PIJ7_9AGAM|nr:hypothetical protein BD410DRAFT_846209 [Rickenella mellea]
MILPCVRYGDSIVILYTVNTKPTTRWSWSGIGSTYVLHGSEFVNTYNKSLPKLYSPLIRLKIDDILSVPLRKRLNRALPVSMRPFNQPTGLARPMSTLAHMAAVLLSERNGTELVTTFSWMQPNTMNTLDIVPVTLLNQHVEVAQAFADGTASDNSDSSDPTTEGFPDLVDHDYPDL